MSDSAMVEISSDASDMNKVRQTIEDLACSAISIAGILYFLCELHAGAIMSFNPRTTTTAQVVFQAIIPLTARSGSSFAHYLNGGRPCHPHVMISHAWSNIFTHLVAAAVAHATNSPSYFIFLPYLQTLQMTEQFIATLSMEVLQTNVWLCIFAVNQHVSICSCHTLKHSNGDPLCQMDKFDKMLEFLYLRDASAFQLTLALDRKALALQRAWVVAELATSLKIGLKPSVQLLFPVKLGDPQVRNVVESLDVNHCQASRLEDKELILNSIEDKNEYNTAVRTLLEQSIYGESMHIVKQALRTSHQVLFLAGVIALLVFSVGGYLKNPLMHMLLFFMVCLMATIFIAPQIKFRGEFLFIFDASSKADKFGLVRELWDEIPHGALRTALVLWPYRKLALKCDGVPNMWRRIALTLHGVSIMCIIIPMAMVIYNSGKFWLVFTAWSVWLIGLVFGTLSLKMIERMLPQRPLRVALFAIRFFVFVLGGLAASMGSFFYRCISQGFFDYKLRPLEQALLLVVFFGQLWIRVGLLYQWRSHHKTDEEELMPASVRHHKAVHETMRGMVYAWAETTLRISGLPEDATPEDTTLSSLIELSRPFGLLGVFLALGLGTATITFSSKGEAAKALASLNEHWAGISPIQLQWVMPTGEESPCTEPAGQTKLSLPKAFNDGKNTVVIPTMKISL